MRAAERLACDDDSGAGFQSLLDFYLTAGIDKLELKKNTLESMKRYVKEKVRKQ